jgi:para-aminobenzoate synthetase component 1
VGWVDADRERAELAVGIRSFFLQDTGERAPRLCFGTGAGITWGSDPGGEWAETELKAARLLQVAAGRLADGSVA